MFSRSLDACYLQYATQEARPTFNIVIRDGKVSVLDGVEVVQVSNSAAKMETAYQPNIFYQGQLRALLAIVFCLMLIGFSEVSNAQENQSDFEIPSAAELQLEFGELGDGESTDVLPNENQAVEEAEPAEFLTYEEALLLDPTLAEPTLADQYLADPSVANSMLDDPSLGNPYADTPYQGGQMENQAHSESLPTEELPVRIYLDDQLLTETINPQAVIEADAIEPILSTEVMDIHLSVNRSKAKRRMSVELIRNEAPDATKRQREKVRFKAKWNYDSFISKAEIRLYKAGELGRGEPVKILKVGRKGYVDWQIPDRLAAKMEFALRLYGKNGGFDQSNLTTFDATGLISTDGLTISGPRPNQGFQASVENVYAESGIELYGAQVNFNISQVPPGHRVLVMGQEIEFFGSSASTDLILPPGDHRVQVSVIDENGQGIAFERKAIVPENDFFYAALGDITLGANTGKSYIDYYQQQGNAGEIDLFESAGIEGQASLFLKGRVLGKYLITAALDTGEGKLDTLFDNVVSRDPNAVLSKINPEETYSVYGDFSQVQNETPTQEKLYVKLERNGSHLLWGSFKTSYRGNTFATIERSLYGAELKFRKTFQTDKGSAQLDSSAFAIPPGQLQQRDEIQGNNGFVYALSNTNILANSEIIRVEVRHPITGVVVEQRDFYFGTDYDIDYLQGQVVLASSLPASQNFGSVLTDNYPVFLVVVYEFIPANADANQFVVGGRSELSIGDFISVGATGLVDGSGPVNQSMLGVDAQVNIGQSSYLKAQVSNTNTIDIQGATAQAEILSSSGFAGVTAANAELNNATAWKLEGGFNLEDLGIESPGSVVSASVEHRDKNFAAPGQGTLTEKNAYQVNAFVPLMDGKFRLDGDVSATEDVTYDQVYRSARLEAEYDINEKATGRTGIEHIAQSGQGERTDVGVGFDYRPTDKLQVGAFASTTVKASPSSLKRNRVGVELLYNPTDKVDVRGSVATGTSGLDARIEAGYTVQPGQRTYASYEIGSDPGGMFTLNPATGPKQGLLKVGSQYRKDQSLNFYAEGALKHESSDILSYTQTGGVSYSPNDQWRFGLDGRLVVGKSYEDETVVESMNGTVSANYTGEKVSVGSSATFTRSRDYLGQGNNDKFETSSFTRFDYDPNWKLYASLNTVFIRNVDTTNNANYISADISAAYRPVENDKFASVFSYKALYDLPTGNNATSVSNIGYKQRSHILSADASYAFTPYFTLSGKYGLKWGQVTTNRNSNDWKSSTVHLLTTRADFNFAKKWDAVLEGRMMHLSEGNSTRYGALAAIYRHFGKNLKVGVGHSYSSVSDDLTNIDAVSDGFFVNVISKF